MCIFFENIDCWNSVCEWRWGDYEVVLDGYREKGGKNLLIRQFHSFIVLQKQNSENWKPYQSRTRPKKGSNMIFHDYKTKNRAARNSFRVLGQRTTLAGLALWPGNTISKGNHVFISIRANKHGSYSPTCGCNKRSLCEIFRFNKVFALKAVRPCSLARSSTILKGVSLTY